MAERAKGQAPEPSSAPAGAPATRPKEIGGYEIISKLGQGAMGAVFKARQKSMDRTVALKILPPSIAKNERFIDRFQREARASAKLNHQNIVQGIDVGRDSASGLWYFAMELVDGPTLKQVLKAEKVIAEERALRIARDMARALECAATHGIVHRDIKPDNILLAPTGEAKLADLGLAKQINDDASVTQSGQAVGTPHYMAPEQVRGQNEKIDPRTDIYALGATLFHLVTGQTPFTGDTSPVVMTKHLTEPPPRANAVNPDVSDACTRLILRMMQKKRDQRFQSATELLVQIERILNHEDTGQKRAILKKSNRSSLSGRTETPPGSLKKLIIAAVAAGFILAGTGVVAFLKWDSLTGKKEVLAAAPAPVAPAIKVADSKSPGKPAVVPVPAAVKVPVVEAIATPDAKPDKPTDKAPEKIEPPKADVVTKKPDPSLVIAAVPEPEKKPDPADADNDAPDSKKPASISAPAPVAAGRAWGGFLAEYYDGQNFKLLKKSQQDQSINFKWKEGPPPGIELEGGTSVRWRGFVEPPENGDYVFDVKCHAGGRLFLDDRLIYDTWAGAANAGKSLPEPLLKGKKYSVTFEVHNRNSDDPTLATLNWGLAGEEGSLVQAEPPEAGSSTLPEGHLPDGWHAEYGKLGSSTPLVKRVESAIYWNWGVGSPALELPVDRFWAEWNGLVTAPETGNYIFHLDADEGARLYINDMLISDFYFIGAGKHDTPALHLEKGKRYLIRMEYLERDETAHCSLTWSSETLAETPVRASGLGDPTGTLPPDGFLAEYGVWGAPKPVLTRREIQPGWNWRSGSPSPEVPVDKFWAKYTGWITPPADGEYTFSFEFDEGLKFYIDEVMLFDSGYRGVENGKGEVGTLTLKGGKHYFMRAEYLENTEYAFLKINWASPEMPKRVITGMVPETFRADSKENGRVDNAMLAEYGVGVGKAPAIRRLEARLNHDYYTGTPGPEMVGTGAFWGRWSAGLKIPVTGKYAFKLTAETTAEVHLNGTSIAKLPIPVVGKAKALTSAQIALARKEGVESQSIAMTKGLIYFLEVSHNSGHRDDYPFIHLMWKPPEKTEFEEIPPDVFVIPPQGRDVRKPQK